MDLHNLSVLVFAHFLHADFLTCYSGLQSIFSNIDVFDVLSVFGWPFLMRVVIGRSAQLLLNFSQLKWQPKGSEAHTYFHVGQFVAYSSYAVCWMSKQERLQNKRTVLQFVWLDALIHRRFDTFVELEEQKDWQSCRKNTFMSSIFSDKNLFFRQFFCQFSCSLIEVNDLGHF